MLECSGCREDVPAAFDGAALLREGRSFCPKCYFALAGELLACCSVAVALDAIRDDDAARFAAASFEELMRPPSHPRRRFRNLVRFYLKHPQEFVSELAAEHTWN